MADREFRVVVAGAGVSGLFMAETLKRAGIAFIVYEKAGEVGGTWRDNTFPGLFVDVLSRGNTSFRSSPTTIGRANTRQPPKFGHISKRLRAIAASPNSSVSTRRSSRLGSLTAGGMSRQLRAAPMLLTSSSAPLGFSTNRSFPILPVARVSPAHLSTQRAGITVYPMRVNAGASSAVA